MQRWQSVSRRGIMGAVLCLGLLLFGEVARAQVELPLVSALGGEVFRVKLAGNYAVIAEGTTLALIDISNPSNPTRTGGIALPGGIQDYHVEGTLVYAAVKTSLEIVDISNAARPALVGTLPLLSPLDSVTPDTAQAIYYYEEGATKWLFVGSGFGFHVVDVTNPAAPDEVDDGYITGSVDWGRGDIDDGFLYALNLSDVFIMDLSDSVFSPPIASTSGRPHEAKRVGNLLYVAHEAGLAIFDVTDPTQPTLLSDTPLGNYVALAVEGNTAYAVNFFERGGTLGSEVVSMHIIDVSNPSAPVLLNTPVEMTEIASTYTEGDIEVRDGKVYFATSLDGLHVYNVATPSTPQLLGKYRSINEAFQVALSGHFVFVTDVLGGLRIVDIAEVEAPRVVSEVSAAALGFAQVYALEVAGNYAYIGGGTINDQTLQFGTCGMKVVDVSDLENPAIVGGLSLPDTVPLAIETDGQYGYVAGLHLSGRITVLDLSNPAAPAILRTFSQVGTTDVTYGLQLVGNTLYSSGMNGLRIFDVSNPTGSQVTLGTTYSGFTGFRQVHVLNNLAYVAGQMSGPDFAILDVSNPASITTMGTYDNTGVAGGVFVDRNGLAYLAAGGRGFKVLDVSNPAAPSLIGVYDDRGFAISVVVGEVAVVAMLEGGLDFISVQPPQPVVSPALPSFIDASSIVVSGTALAGSYVTISGGAYPVYQQLAEGESAFSMTVELKQESVNRISVATVNRFGLTSYPTITQVVEGTAFPSAITTVTSLALAPTSDVVNLGDRAGLTATATFSNSATAEVTQYVNYEVTNDEQVTPGGLYFNTKTGAATVTARTVNEGLASNTATFTDGAKDLAKAALHPVSGRIIDNETGKGIGPGTATLRGYSSYTSNVVGQQDTLDAEGNFAFMLADGVYDFRGSSTSYRSLQIQEERLGLPEGEQLDLPIWQRKQEVPSLSLELALRPNDVENPIIEIIEPLNGAAFGLPEVGVTAITYDRLSELVQAVLFIDGTPYNVLNDITTQDFYRNVWPANAGAHTLQLKLKDSAGNLTESAVINFTIDSTPLELLNAVAPSPTRVLVTFNKPVPDPRVLLNDRYAVASTAKVPLVVTGVTRISDTRVLLTTETQTIGANYTLSIFGVGDAYGNLIRVLTTVAFDGYDTASDQDGDGLLNTVESGTGIYVSESNTGSFSNNEDSDSDTLPDGWEVTHGLNPNSAAGVDGASGNPDGDGWTNAQEHDNHTDPNEADSDGDGIDDDADPNPNLSEIFDADNDGMPDSYEIAHAGLNAGVNDASGDLDNDGLTNLTEYRIGTNPGNAHSDADGLSDGGERNRYGTNPLLSDTDGDSASDSAEVAAGTDPLTDSRVKTKIVQPPNGTTLRGNRVTLTAETTNGRASDLANVAFQIRAAGSSDPWVNIAPASGTNPDTSAPYQIAWDADAAGDASYELRARATSKVNLVDTSPQVTTLTVSSGAVYVEEDTGAEQTIVRPVLQASENVVTIADLARGLSATITIPAGALSANAQLRVSLLDPSGFNPILEGEAATGIYIEILLIGATLNLAPGQTIGITLGYPDTDQDDIFDGSDLPEDYFELKYLNEGTNRFEAIVSSSVDPIANQVSGGTDHLSIFSIVAEVPVAPVQIDTTTLPAGVVDEPYNATLVASAGVAPYTWTMSIYGNLPPGLVRSGDTITGAPATAGNYSFGITVTDSQDPASTDVRNFSIAVAQSNLWPPIPIGAPLYAWPLLLAVPAAYAAYTRNKRR